MSDDKKKIGHVISKAEAAKLKANWKEKKGKIETRSNFFGADCILALVNKPGFVGIHIHHGVTSDNKMAPILVAEFDAVAATTEYDGGTNASQPCPPFCPPE